MVKLTPTQQKVVEAFENAIHYYTSEDIHMGESNVYIDGERHYFTEDGRQRNVAFIIGENEFAYESNTNTIKSLIKKGIIDESNSIINGTGLDKLKINIQFEKPQPKIYTDFTKVTAYEMKYNSFSKCDVKVNHELIAPTEQIDELISKQWNENCVITSRTDFTATVHNFK